MSTISGVSGAGSGWGDFSASRAGAMKARMFEKVDSDGSGSVDQAELQTLLDKMAKRSGGTAADAGQTLTKMDSNGDGSLDAAELADGMKSLMPAPKSTVDFAQQRSGAHSGEGVDKLFSKLDSDGSGGLNSSELNTLLDRMAGDGGASDGVSADAQSAADAAIFKALDTNGDGSIGKDELKAALQPAAGQAGATQASAPPPPGGPPPGPPPGARIDADDGDDHATSTSGTSASSTTASDPLDTNGDGVVSAQERAAGALKDLMTAMDNNQDGSVSKDELKSFVSQMAQASAVTSTSAGSSDTASNSASDPRAAQGRFQLSALAALVKSEYANAAAGYAANSNTISVAA